MASSESGKKPTIVLITGANTGLGFEIAKALFARPEPYHVILGARGDISRTEEAISKLKAISPNTASTAQPLSIDITSDESIAAAAEKVGQSPGYVDVLVNNAGADFDLSIAPDRLTKRQAFQRTWDVNVVGTHLITEAFAPLLLSFKCGPPRLLFMTSGMSSITENATGTSIRYTNPPAGWPKPQHSAGPLGGGMGPFAGLAYRSSKAGLNMMVTEWARVLREDGVKVFDISPGFLATGLGADRETGDKRDLVAMGAARPEVGGEFCADVVAGGRDGLAWPVRVLKRDAVQPW